MFASKEWVKDLLTKVFKKNNEKINESLSTKIIETVHTTEEVTTESGAFNVFAIPKPAEEYILINTKLYATSNSTHLYQYTATVVENRHLRVLNNYPKALTDAFTVKAYWIKL